VRGLGRPAGAVRGARYGLVADLQNNFRSALISRLSGAPVRTVYRPGRAGRFGYVRFRIPWPAAGRPVALKYIDSLRRTGASDDGLGLELAVPPDAARRVAELLSRAGAAPGRPLLVLAPGAGRRTKRWPADRFAEVGAHFARRGYAVALAGGPADAGACAAAAARLGSPAADLSGALSLTETAALIGRGALLVTNDTGVMHLASALGVPAAAVFGPTTRHFGFFPFRAPARVVERELACRPCSYHGTDRCPRTHFRCMLDVPARDVIAAAEELLSAETP
jgi:heptosyltransferase-2